MPDVRVRGLDKDVVHLLKAQAQRLGKDWQDFLHDTLREAVRRPRRELVAELQKFQTELREKYGEMPDSTPDIRAWRDGL